jgi:hypothetical protein
MSGALWPATKARKAQYEGRRSHELRELELEQIVPLRTGTSRGRSSTSVRVPGRVARRAGVPVWNVGGRYGPRGWCANGECSLHRRRAHRHLPLQAPARFGAFAGERCVVAGDEAAKSAI